MDQPRAGPRMAARIIGLLLLLLATSAAAATDRQTRALPWAPGRSLAIELTIASVTIEGSDRADVELVIERHAPTMEGLARIPVAIDDGSSRVTVRGVQSDGAADPAYRVDLIVRAPRSVVIDRVDVLEGKISISQFAGTLTADLKRGPIEGVDVSGILRLETGIGSISLARTTLVPYGLLRLRTFNGDVHLGLAERPADARILALALNGTIRSDIPLTVKDTWGPRWSETTLGRGEPVISLDVVTGTIEIKSPRP